MVELLMYASVLEHVRKHARVSVKNGTQTSHEVYENQEKMVQVRRRRRRMCVCVCVCVRERNDGNARKPSWSKKALSRDPDQFLNAKNKQYKDTMTISINNKDKEKTYRQITS